LERLGSDHDDRDRLIYQSGIFRVEEFEQQNSVVAGGGGAETPGNLRGTAHMVDVRERDKLFLTSAHTFGDLLREQSASARRSTLQGNNSEGSLVDYKVYLFPSELVSNGYRLARPH
jgi:hypothetical protein